MGSYMEWPLHIQTMTEVEQPQSLALTIYNGCIDVLIVYDD